MVTGDENRDIYLEHRKNESGIRVRGHFIPFMKEGQELDVIVCVRKGWNPLEERGVIVPGSQTGKCDTCGQDIWLAPSTQELKKKYPSVPTRCVECVVCKETTGRRKMIKPKGAGTLLGIILASVCGWVAIVGLVIKPSILVGSALSVAGGAALGVVAAF
ncbi:unnamed protein product, partial [marine sediment metagenome]